MKQEVLKHFPYIFATCIAMCMFLSVFVGACLWVFRKNSTKIYGAIMNLPLEDSSNDSK